MEDTTPWVVSGIVALVGILGLFLAAGAVDTGIYAFGLLLFVFAVLFIFARIRRAFDDTEIADGGARHQDA